MYHYALPEFILHFFFATMGNPYGCAIASIQQSLYPARDY
jgi:hypothetical protein